MSSLLKPREINRTGTGEIRVDASGASIKTIIHPNLHPMKKKSVSQSAFFNLRVLLGLLLCFAGIMFVFFAFGPTAAGQPRTRSGYASPPTDGFAIATKIAPWVMEHTANGQQAEFFVVLADQADLSGAANLQTKNEKARFVYDTLLNKSQTTQDRILQWLRDRAIEHQSFYIVNAILVKGTRQIADTLAARPDVARVEGNPLIHNDLPQPGRCGKIATSRPGHNRTRNQLHPRATGMGAGIHRAKHCYRERRYRPALDAQRT